MHWPPPRPALGSCKGWVTGLVKQRQNGFSSGTVRVLVRNRRETGAVMGREEAGWAGGTWREGRHTEQTLLKNHRTIQVPTNLFLRKWFTNLPFARSFGDSSHGSPAAGHSPLAGTVPPAVMACRASLGGCAELGTQDAGGICYISGQFCLGGDQTPASAALPTGPGQAPGAHASAPAASARPGPSKVPL